MEIIQASTRITKYCILFTLIIGSFLSTQKVSATSSEPMAVDVYSRGEVMSVEKEDLSIELAEPLLTQFLKIKLISGEEKGKEVTVEYQIRGTDQEKKKLQPGDQVIIDKNILPDGTVNYYATEPFRLPALVWLGVVFFVLTLITAGKKGLFSFLGLLVTLAIIAFFIVPQISQGANPFTVSLIGAALIASVSLAVGHGFNKQTGIALLSIMITISLAMGLSIFFVNISHLFGLGSEEAFYLQTGMGQAINLRGLLLGGMIIGVLGVLDDVATAQVAAVAELRAANAALSAKELYIRASRIGREHIVAVVNTLVLAYVGAAFPLVLLFHSFQLPWWVTLNTEMISEEVVRTLIGSVALVAAVPIATALAVWYFHRQSK